MRKYFLILIALIIVGWPQVATAQVTPSPGLSISPFLVELEVDKGATAQTEISLSNTFATPLIISVAGKDFLPGLDGEPRFVPDAEINDRTFSLASWMTAAPAKFTIEPGQTINVPVKIAPPADAESGTHYGAILFSFSGVNMAGEAADVTQSLGTIALVRYGQAREAGSVDLQIPQKFYFNSDRINFKNLFSNTGNVHVKPKGEIYIKNTFGKIVATPFVNRDAASVLPKTDRTFVNSWVPSVFAFGRYTAESVIQFGNSRLESRDRQVVWILPWYLLGPLIIVIALLIWFPLHGKHLYHRRVIRRHEQKNQQ